MIYNGRMGRPRPPSRKGNMPMPQKLSTIDRAVEAIARGESIIVMDAEDRENEGDFVCAAEKVTPEIVNFMISHGRGLLCMPVLPDVCERLDLPPMVDENTAPWGHASRSR